MAAIAKPASNVAPMSVEEIVKQANNFEYNFHIPLRYWLRSADTIQKEAQIYEREGNDQQTYLLLFRHALLILEKLAQHPEAKDPKARTALLDANNVVKKDLAKLEQLKPRIEKRYAQYLEDKDRRNADKVILKPLERGGQNTEGLTDDMGQASIYLRRISDPELSGQKQTLDAGENRALAAKLAHKEIRRRDTARRAVRQAGVSEAEEQERRVGGLWGDWEKALSTHDEKDEADRLSRDIIEARRRRDVVNNGNHGASEDVRNFYPASYQDSPSQSLPLAQQTSSYQYPSIPQRSTYQGWDNTDMAPLRPSIAPKPPPKTPIRSLEAPPRTALPILPPKLFQESIKVAPPPIPGKLPHPEYSDPIPRSQSTTPSQELNAGDYTFKPTAYLENGTPLRTVFLPPELRTQFLNVAAPNTRNNLETCGILCGTLISNALFISRLVIPEQKSTSDTCETLNESALFDYCDSEDLMVLGWIHTHPSQTCFMSSRDLHTHCGYQVMMPESIAIVCAPSKEPSWGVFRLTDPPGMKTVLNCQKSGLFHPHDVPNIYTNALKPGHVFELPGLEFHVVDQRP
ncbi:hypothetical protein AOQ84DRAFT_401672 [Glonium stellatum]|uniref:MPN domain-containing protein n=1 Tax=Glonium stellatum TaxID=574774 RepID=A0A8E2EMX6_9PEZI|nr:hypothetical protein AOQ84DRAFT_401672 [Glonium stellatum]